MDRKPNTKRDNILAAIIFAVCVVLFGLMLAFHSKTSDRTIINPDWLLLLGVILVTAVCYAAMYFIGSLIGDFLFTKVQPKKTTVNIVCLVILGVLLTTYAILYRSGDKIPALVFFVLSLIPGTVRRYPKSMFRVWIDKRRAKRAGDRDAGSDLRR